MSSATQGNETCLPPTQDKPQVNFPEATAPGPQNPQGYPTMTVGDQVFVVRHGLDEVSTLCQVGMTPRVVTGLLIRILKNHFADPTLIMDPKLQQYVWDENSQKSKIRIVQNAYFDAKSAGQLPALIVGRGALQSKRISMDDRTQNMLSGTDAALSGFQRYTRFHEVQFTITAITEVLGEADDLATEVFDTLTYLSPMMTERLPFHDFQVVGMGPVGALTETGTQLAVPIQLTAVYEYAWTLQPLAPRLKTLSIHPT